MMKAVKWLAAFLCAAAMGSNVNAQVTQVFYDDFSSGKTVSGAWEISKWVNGPPFGCTFSDQNVAVRKGALSLSFSGSSGKCAEVRTRQYWQYGSYVVDMKPANLPGTVSSFFMYDGVAGTASHFEIDIEFIGGSSLLYTNYWMGGVPHSKAIDLKTLGIDPFKTTRRYTFVWQSDSIAWHVMNDAGQWQEIRREYVSLNAPMKLMMNAWYGDNMGDALIFPGRYDGTAGKAEYHSVWIGQ